MIIPVYMGAACRCRILGTDSAQFASELIPDDPDAFRVDLTKFQAGGRRPAGVRSRCRQSYFVHIREAAAKSDLRLHGHFADQRGAGNRHCHFNTTHRKLVPGGKTNGGDDIVSLFVYLASAKSAGQGRNPR